MRRATRVAHALDLFGENFYTTAGGLQWVISWVTAKIGQPIPGVFCRWQSILALLPEDVEARQLKAVVARDLFAALPHLAQPLVRGFAVAEFSFDAQYGGQTAKNVVVAARVMLRLDRLLHAMRIVIVT